MSVLIIILFLLVVIFAIAGPIFYLNSRRILREQKNYERGLKMVPILIHLPPMSDDIEGGSRDARDVMDENVSKAQVLYTIIASTFEKGFKKKFYGQRHFTFEIIGTKGFVNYYTAVPIAMVNVVSQAIISAYPNVNLEEVAEHNIFSPVGKVSGTLGGELTLKENFAYPIATLKDINRDPMQSILNALSNLDKEDGVGIQILMRPANASWRKKASIISGKMRKGDSLTKPGIHGFGWWFKHLITGFWKPPEHSGKDDSKPVDISGLNQSIIDAIDDKTRHAGYETLIRVVTSSNILQKAQSNLNNVVASFALFDSPGRNGFKWTPANDVDNLITAYILRFFPQENDQNILNSVELASIFHFPDQQSIPTSQLGRQASKEVDGPRNLPDEGLLLGYNVFRGTKKAIRLSITDRARHIYIVGQTGTGKSTFLENLALQDMLNGDGFAFIDPHGDSAEVILSMVPKERAEDVIYFCPADMDFPLGLNMFEHSTEDEVDFIVQETFNMLKKLYDPENQGIMGPRYEHIYRNAALVVMADPEGGTFIDIPKLFNDPQFLKDKLKHVKDPAVLDYWLKEYPASARSNDFGEVKAWFVSKFGAFISNNMMRNIVGQTKSAFDLREIMDNKKILIVNLSKGRTGDLNSNLLGMIFVMKFQAAAMSRANIPEDQRQDFCLYVDEFQNFATDSFATIMSEARKYHLNLIVGNQFVTQLSQEIRDAVFGNMGTIVAYRIGQNDVEALSNYFKPLFEGEDLLRVPNFNSVVRTLVSGVPSQPFSMAALEPLGLPNTELAGALKQLTAAKYGKPRAQVEAETTQRVYYAHAEPQLQMPNQPLGTSLPSMNGTNPAQMPGPKKPGSFLDEWLAKRSKQQSRTSVPQQTKEEPITNISDNVQPVQMPQQINNDITQEPKPNNHHSGEIKISGDQKQSHDHTVIINRNDENNDQRNA